MVGVFSISKLLILTIKLKTTFMGTTKYYPRLRLRELTFVALSVIFMLVQSCKKVKKDTVQLAAQIEKEVVFEIITEDMNFIAPDTISQGWNTWRYINKSEQPHYILIDHYKEGVTVKEYKEHILPPFGEGVAKLYEGKNDQAMAAFGKFPDWYAETKWHGGVGLLSPGKTAETTIQLEPGYYIIECYVKMNNGMFHSNMGMYKELIVSDNKSTIEEPTADVVVDISSGEGIEFNAPTQAGTYTFEVNFLDQKKYGNFVGHDVNLVKIADNYDVAIIEAWMNWIDLEGLIDPVPEGFEFLGGVNDMTAGSKGFFKAKFEPGTYALISEVPNSSDKNLLKTFVISD